MTIEITEDMIERAQDTDWQTAPSSREAIARILTAVLSMEEVYNALLADRLANFVAKHADDDDAKLDQILGRAASSALKTLDAAIDVDAKLQEVLRMAKEDVTEEPTELGAQVVDTEGDVWTRVEDGWVTDEFGIGRWREVRNYAPLRRVL